MLIRYPGSKDKHLKFLAPHVEELLSKNRNLCELFAGTASITFFALKNNLVDSYHINDFDIEIVNMWKTVKDNPAYLISQIEAYTPNIEDFYEWKASEPHEDPEIMAFRKIVLHQVSYSGLGRKAGGPIGGKKQAGTYKVNARWSPKRLVKGIGECSTLLNSVQGQFTHKSWDKCLEEVPQDSAIYLDPPYFVKGGELYFNGGLDHESLAKTLKEYPNWLLSYDEHEYLRELYNYADIEPLTVRSHLHHNNITDLAIKPFYPTANMNDFKRRQ